MLGYCCVVARGTVMLHPVYDVALYWPHIVRNEFACKMQYDSYGAFAMHLNISTLHCAISPAACQAWVRLQAWQCQRGGRGVGCMLL